jgi:hypothetical protein
MRKVVLCATLALGLSGCAGMDAAMQYDDVDPVHFQAGDATWRIFDKPTEHRLMITPTIGESMTEGLWSGLTFGAADTEIPKPTYQHAVEAWLAHTGRNCAVTDGYKLIKPQWEFTYRCY